MLQRSYSDVRLVDKAFPAVSISDEVVFHNLQKYARTRMYAFRESKLVARGKHFNVVTEM